MQKDSKIYVAGHNGMVGSAILRKLKAEGYTNLITRSSSELDLTKQSEVDAFFQREKPEYVFLAAARVGGIKANDIYRGEFIYENLMIQTNVVHAAHVHTVTKLLFLGSSCIYPKYADQPLREEYLLTDILEPTNEPYAVAKIAGIKLCESYKRQYGDNFISVMPTNLYGPGDNYNLENSHALPALIRKIHTAKEENIGEVEVWGTGAPRREFLHADDLADACYFLMMTYNEEQFLNIGTGEDISIKELAELIQEIIGYKGKLVFNTSVPDGAPRKLMEMSRLHGLGWKHKINLKEGITQVYKEIEERGFIKT